MERRPTTQDITWLLDLNRNGQLDLDPPYQRRSVWTRRDRQFFLDTIFRNYPSPAIFFDKTIADDGTVTYHVVDGKQRLETILAFVNNKIRLSTDYGDIRLNGKRWKDIAGDVELKHQFWNYQVPVEMIDVMAGELVNNVFDRLNRNSRRLTAQELRHAKFEGWFITLAETEAEAQYWQNLGIVTRARSNRMIDVQFISELIMVILKGRPEGFDQDALDEAYADYDDISDVEELPDFSEDEFFASFRRAKKLIGQMNDHEKTVSTWAKGFGPFYTLWCSIALSEGDRDGLVLAERYASFMAKVEELADHPPGTPLPQGEIYGRAAEYRENARGASTEPAQRQKRFEALNSILFK
ncbi:DUF262 domain-containing protein [Mesorhizobium kowhaii]|uniref:DUF262 domain-containing protein n=1 Tax=Mesorhizobium kowhaii TaxID=1300272 RepID=UPI0035E71868